MLLLSLLSFSRPLCSLSSQYSLFFQFSHRLCSLIESSHTLTCSPVLSVLTVLPSSLFSLFSRPLCSLSPPVDPLSFLSSLILSVLLVLPSSLFSQFSHPLSSLSPPVLFVLSLLLSSLLCGKDLGVCF